MKNLYAILALAILSQCPNPAAAQTAANAPPTPASAASAAQPMQVDQVVVTANRRIETLQSVAGVVQTIDGEQLRRDGITEIRELQNAIPGMNIANQEGNIEIYIRGVGSSNNTELGDPAAAPHINGIYIPRPRGMGTMFYDLERVEVNKGPQGTLYGRNAMAGTLNIITAKPRLDHLGGFVQFGGGDRDSGFEAAINVPLSSTFALRAAGFQTSKNSGFHNVSPDPASHALDPAGKEDNTGARLSVLWVPTDRLTVSAMFDAGHESGTGYPGANIFSAVKATGLRPEHLPLRDVVYLGAQGTMHNDLSGVQAKVSYDFEAFGAELSLSQRKVDFYQRNAHSDGIAWPGRDYSAEKWDDFSTQYWQTKSNSKVGEFRLFSQDSKDFQWNVGAFAFGERQGVGYLSQVDGGYCCYSGTEFTMPKVIGRSAALFADGTLTVASHLRLIGGLRETEEAKSRYGIGGNIALTLGGAGPNGDSQNGACCMATRLGTEGFAPNLLARPNFDMSKVQTPAQLAQFLMETTMTPGARDTLNAQVGPIANGTNPKGNCFVRADISNGFVTCPNDQNGGFSYANLTVPDQQVGSSKFHYTDWRLGTEYDLTRDNMLYAKVSTGHKAGGFNDSFHGSTVPEQFRPERLRVYEAGSRNAFTLGGQRGVFNLSGFFYDYNDQVFQDLTCITVDNSQTPPKCSGYSLVNRNIGKSRLAGLEAEARIGLPGGFKLDMNGALLHTRISSGTVADVRAIDYGAGGKSPLINLTGNQLPLASRLNLSTRLQQVVPLFGGKADWQALLNWRSSYYLSQFNERPVVANDGTTKTALAAGFPDRQIGFLTLNLGAGYTFDGGFRLEAFVNNATNKEASQKALVGADLDIRFLNDARSYGARARMDF